MPDEKIEYALSLSLGQFSRSLKLAAGKVDDVQKDMRRSLNRTGGAFEAVGKSLAVGVAAGVAASIIALNKLKNEFVDSLGLAAVQEAAEIKLGGVIKATGEAAGFSIGELKKYASELQDLTAVGDEVTLTNMGILASFKQIKGDQFKGAIKSAIDMSKVLDQDLKTSVLAIGKALNDPVAGMGALSRYGIAFTEAEKVMIKSMVESGSIMEAQGLIIDKLNGKFAGVAEELRNSVPGAWDAAKGAYADMLEKVGNAVIQNDFFKAALDDVEASLKILGATVEEHQAQLRNLAKDGFLNVVDAIGFTIDMTQHLYNAFKGFGAIGRTFIIGLLQVFETLSKVIRNTVLKPIDMLFDALVLVGRLDVNPLKNFEDELSGFKDFSADEFLDFMDGVADKNDAFNRSREAIENFKKRIEEIPATYKRAETASEDNKDVAVQDVKEITTSLKLIEGEWVNVYDTAIKASNDATAKIIANNQKICGII
jgi:hypothetical protein